MLGLQGLHSARRGDYRVIYRIDDARMVAGYPCRVAIRGRRGDRSGMA